MLSIIRCGLRRAPSISVEPRSWRSTGGKVLTTSHRARIALLEEQLEQATNEKIQKMRRSQIAAAEADYARRIQELDIAMERAEITAGPVAYGVIQVDEGSTNAE